MLQICENGSFAESKRLKMPVASGEASSDDTVNARGGATEKENSRIKNDDDTSNADRAHMSMSSDDSNMSIQKNG